MSEQIRVKIIGDHPHAGESGYFKIVDGKFSTTKAGAGTMWEIVLEDCKHGTAGCFAAQPNIKVLSMEALRKYYAERRDTL